MLKGLLLAFTGLLIAAFPGQAAHAASKPVRIDSMDGCPACEVLASYLQERGVSLVTTRTSRGGSAYYPRVVYSDGSKDSGEKLRSGLCRLPSTIRVSKFTY